jgi:CRISPR-associated protein Cmr6
MVPNLQKMNLNYLLNKAYYEPMTYAHFKLCNNALKNKVVECKEEIIPVKNELHFPLKTIYPGLLLGLGYAHAAAKDLIIDGTKDDGAQIALGFTLDYVTGLPIIPGSTVKGVLRSAFENHPEYIIDTLEKSKISISTELKEYEKFWKSVFEEGANKVVFFDAIPVEAGKDGHLFGLEHITPHTDGPLKNPTPIKLLKVIPGVTFLFRFGFQYWENAEGVTAEQLRDTFRTILCDLGIGAKTNVGFGAMEKVGICQWEEGCKADTIPKKGGGYHPFCQEHFLKAPKNQKGGETK